jgi:hypothetical protein
MDQRSTVLYLHLKGLSAQAIYDGLVATLGGEALPYSTVTKYVSKAQSNAAKLPSNPDASSPHLDDSDRVIWAALEEKLFSSVRKLA